MRITVKPYRDEALKAGFASLLDRLPHAYSFEQFKGAMEPWDIQAFCDGEKIVGMLMTRGPELHVAVIPEVRGKWLSRRLIREVFSPILNKYGQAIAAVMPENEAGKEFTSRLGFAGDLHDLRVGFDTLRFDPITAAIGIGGSLLGGVLSSKASKSAAQTQAAAANNATDTQLQMFNTQNAQLEPYRQAGYNALSNLQYGLGTGPAPAGSIDAGLSPNQFTHQFDANDLKTNLAPNYQFQLQQGQGAATNALNVTGGLGGNFAKGLVDYTVNKAGDAYQNAFNNYNTNQSNIFNRLSTIAGYGAGANQQSTALASGLAPAIANSQIGAGSAQAAGIVGSANAVTGGLNNALGWYTLGNMNNPAGGGTPYATLAATPFNDSSNYG